MLTLVCSALALVVGVYLAGKYPKIGAWLVAKIERRA